MVLSEEVLQQSQNLVCERNGVMMLRSKTVSRHYKIPNQTMESPTTRKHLNFDQWKSCQNFFTNRASQNLSSKMLGKLVLLGCMKMFIFFHVFMSNIMADHYKIIFMVC